MSYPYWGANGIVDHINSWLFDVVVDYAPVGATGRSPLLGEDGAPFFKRYKDVAFYVSGRIWVNNHAHVLRPVNNTSPRFLAYLLNIVDYRAFIFGTTRDKLTQDDMNNISVQIPPAAEQRTALISAAVTGKIDVRKEVA